MARWRPGTFQPAAETIVPAHPISVSAGFPCFAILCQASSTVPDFNRVLRLSFAASKSKFSLRKKPRCSHVGFSAQSLICHELNEWLSSLRLPCESPTVDDIAISVLAGSFTLFSRRNARQLNPRKRRWTPSLNSTSHSAKSITPAYRSSIAAITPFVPAYSDATCSDMRSMAVCDTKWHSRQLGVFRM